MIVYVNGKRCDADCPQPCTDNQSTDCVPLCDDNDKVLVQWRSAHGSGACVIQGRHAARAVARCKRPALLLTPASSHLPRPLARQELPVLQRCRNLPKRVFLLPSTPGRSTATAPATATAAATARTRPTACTRRRRRRRRRPPRPPAPRGTGCAPPTRERAGLAVGWWAAAGAVAAAEVGPPYPSLSKRCAARPPATRPPCTRPPPPPHPPPSLARNAAPTARAARTSPAPATPSATGPPPACIAPAAMVGHETRAALRSAGLLWQRG